MDINRINQYADSLMKRHNTTPQSKFNGLTPEEMHHILNYPFSAPCIVELNTLNKDQYEQIPLVRQTLFLLDTLLEQELKLTQNGWLPLKIVTEAYHLGQPEWIIEEFGNKRLNEYEVRSVCMARGILELLGWTKIRKGVLSLTAKGKKALSDRDAIANEILRTSLTEVGKHNFDPYNEDKTGNFGIAYHVWLIHKYASIWMNENFIHEEFHKAFQQPTAAYVEETYVLTRLFYWLGIIEQRLNKQATFPFNEEYKKTDLLTIVFTFRKS